jgi:signal transduction histidine kinase
VQVVERARELVGERALELRVERGSRVPPAIETDAEHLERVLFHLVSNAITYTEQGSVVLRVEGQAGSSSRVTFAVADTGPGFSPEMRAHLFEPFCHAYTELHDERDGAGIGLYLSKRMARALGGDLALAPHPGPGSRLELSIDTALFSARTRSHG